MSRDYRDRFQRLDPPPPIQPVRPPDASLQAFLKQFVATCPSAPGWGPHRIQAQLKASMGHDVALEYIQWAVNQ